MTPKQLRTWCVAAVIACVATNSSNLVFRTGKSTQVGIERSRGASGEGRHGRNMDAARQLLSENPAIHTLNDRIIFSVFSGSNEVVCTVCLVQILTGLFKLGNNRVQQEIAGALNSPQLDKATETAIQVLARDPTLKSFFRSYYSANAFPQCHQLFGQQLRNKCEKHRHFITEQGQVVDFRRPSTVNTINSQVSEATDGEITQLFTRLPFDTELVMASALTFSANWPGQLGTRLGNFLVTSTNRRHRSITMLEHEDWLPLLTNNNDHIQGVALPYGDTGAVRLFLFRTESCSEDIRSSLYQRHLQELNRAGAERNVFVQFPQFRVNSKKRDYVDMLRQMNVSTVFERGLGVHERLRAEQLVHDAVLQVDRDGTKAAGAAGAFVVPLSAKPTPFKLVFDCQFVAVLYHRELDIPLFTAYITDPTVS